MSKIEIYFKDEKVSEMVTHFLKLPKPYTPGQTLINHVGAELLIKLADANLCYYAHWETYGPCRTFAWKGIWELIRDTPQKSNLYQNLYEKGSGVEDLFYSYRQNLLFDKVQAFINGDIPEEEVDESVKALYSEADVTLKEAVDFWDGIPRTVYNLLRVAVHLQNLWIKDPGLGEEFFKILMEDSFKKDMLFELSVLTNTYYNLVHRHKEKK
ncbi:MAG: hypothetical protein OEY01_03580 [Desulfobulbaceae bacterium]|nr:hypothetical protein [Desulfobulbaceae bacterium]